MLGSRADQLMLQAEAAAQVGQVPLELAPWPVWTLLGSCAGQAKPGTRKMQCTHQHSLFHEGACRRFPQSKLACFPVQELLMQAAMALMQRAAEKAEQSLAAKEAAQAAPVGGAPVDRCMQICSQASGSRRGSARNQADEMHQPCL